MAANPPTSDALCSPGAELTSHRNCPSGHTPTSQCLGPAPSWAPCLSLPSHMYLALFHFMALALNGSGNRKHCSILINELGCFSFAILCFWRFQRNTPVKGSGPDVFGGWIFNYWFYFINGMFKFSSNYFWSLVFFRVFSSIFWGTKFSSYFPLI